MIWDNITILKQVKTGTDELGNDQFGFTRSKTMKARATAPNDVPVSLDDRLVSRKETTQMSLDSRFVTKNEQVFVMPTKRENLPALDFIEHNGQIYRVLAVETLTPRFTRIRAVTYENHTFRR